MYWSDVIKCEGTFWEVLPTKACIKRGEKKGNVIVYELLLLRFISQSNFLIPHLFPFRNFKFHSHVSLLLAIGHWALKRFYLFFVERENRESLILLFH